MLCTEVCKLLAPALSPPRCLPELQAGLPCTGISEQSSLHAAECWGHLRGQERSHPPFLQQQRPAEMETEIASADDDVLPKGGCSGFPFPRGGKFGPEQVELNCEEPDGRWGNKRLLQPRGKLEAAGSRRHGQGPAWAQPGNSLE